MLYYVKASPLWNLTMFPVKRVQMAMHRCEVVRVGSNDDFLQISTCGQNP